MSAIGVCLSGFVKAVPGRRLLSFGNGLGSGLLGYMGNKKEGVS